ncbi:MAG: hypothetical protein HY072_08170 [Deltaproteobacteria bacterium]|nr:hypothetical protein [Deltaproteobacteria bacterium]
MKNKIFLGLLVLGFAIVWTPGYSDTQTTTAATSEAKAPSIKDTMSITYVNQFFGPAVTNPFSGMQPDVNLGRGSQNAPLGLTNWLGIAFKLNQYPNIALEPVIKFELLPVREHDFTMKDPYLKLKHTKLVNIGNFNLYADLRLVPGVTTASRTKNLVGSVISKQVASYDIPDTKFCISSTTVVVASFYSGYAVGKPDLIVDVSPNVSYSLLPNLTVDLSYALETAHVRGATFSNQDITLDPGITWDITPTVQFQPYLDFKLNKRVALDTTTVGFFFTAKLL